MRTIGTLATAFVGETVNNEAAAVRMPKKAQETFDAWRADL